MFVFVFEFQLLGKKVITSCVQLIYRQGLKKNIAFARRVQALGEKFSQVVLSKKYVGSFADHNEETRAQTGMAGREDQGRGFHRTRGGTGD